MDDVVIGIDASTTAVKAIAFRRDGAELFQTRETYPLSNPAPGHFEGPGAQWQARLPAAGAELRGWGDEGGCGLGISGHTAAGLWV